MSVVREAVQYFCLGNSSVEVSGSLLEMWRQNYASNLTNNEKGRMLRHRYYAANVSALTEAPGLVVNNRYKHLL